MTKRHCAIELVSLLCIVSVLVSLAQAQEPLKATEKSLAYLMLTQKVQEGSPEVQGYARGSALPGIRLAAQIEKLGFRGREVAAFSPGLTMDYLKQFNVIVMGAGGEGGQHSLFSPLADEKMGVILDYVRQGGGLLVLRNPGWQFGKDIEEFNQWRRATGIEILDGQILDEEDAVKSPSGWTLFWTDNVADHPAAKGVEGVFYPDVDAAYMRYTDFSSPVKASPDWTILVSGRKTAHTIHRKKSGVLQEAVPGTYKSAPPFLAVRDFGKGRIAVLPVASTCLWQDGYHAFWGDGLTMEGETKGMKGSGARLLANLFTYLSDPSRGTFGGYTAKPSPPAAAPAALDWDKIRVEGISRKECHLGLIGARSALSSGKEEPLEFIQAAQEAGYGFIAFAEDLDRLTEEKFATLKRICREQSGDAFKAYPGFAYRDESGNQWVTFSDSLFWPKKEWFSARHPGCLGANNSIARGCGNPPIILTQSHRNPEGPWFQGNFNAFALFTYENERQTDESLDHYLRLIRMSFRAAPLVVRFVDSPEQVKKARTNGFQSYVRWYDDNVVEALTGFSPMHKGRHVWLWSSFVSEGPVIEEVTVVNAGTTDLTAGGADRCRLHVMVSSPDGLREVAILDGDRERPWRRFLPGGKERLDETMDFFHDMQHDLVVVATDRNGRRAVSWHNPTRVQENAFHRCSDNFNTMPRGKWWGEPKDLLNARGFENYLAVRNFMYCGAPRLPGVKETERPAIEYYPTLACRFGSIVDTFLNCHYPPGATANPDQTDVPLRAEKNECLAGKVRYTFYTARQDSSLIELVQGDLDVLRDFSSSDGFLFQAPGRKDARCVCATLEDGRFFSGFFSRNMRHVAGELPERGYAALFPDPFCGSLGVVSLQRGLRYSSHTGPDLGHGNLYLRLPKDNAEFKQGEKVRYEYLAVNGALGASPDNGFMDDIIRSLGIAGKTAYEIQPLIGSVEGRVFSLGLKAQDGGFAGKVSQARLPLDLPVRITGLNPRWDAGVLYKGDVTLVVPEWIINEFGQRYVERRPRKTHNEIVRFPVLDDGVGFLQIDTEIGDKEVFIGNLLVSDDPDVRLTLTDTRPGRVEFVVHNPKDTPVTCRVRPAPGFDLLGEFEEEVNVPPGSSVSVKR